MLPFFLFGMVFLISAPFYIFMTISAGPAFLKINENELKNDRQLFAEGFIPRYSKKEGRETIEAELICYRVYLLEEDIFAVEKPVSLSMGQQMQKIIADDGTTFSVACNVPSIDKKKENPKKSGVHYVWHLQCTIKEKIRHKQKAVNVYTWVLAFPLPID